MSVSTGDLLKMELIANNQEFRQLVQEHKNYEMRLGELAALPYPSNDELLEVAQLKKKKLLVKDKMESMVQVYKRKAASH
ncbi:MAG: hypothetical protein FD167_4334 [bacterium]|nr:MAG: hypothetical protein FD167_4334 [bacterium]